MVGKCLIVEEADRGVPLLLIDYPPAATAMIKRRIQYLGG